MAHYALWYRAKAGQRRKILITSLHISKASGGKNRASGLVISIIFFKYTLLWIFVIHIALGCFHFFRSSLIRCVALQLTHCISGHFSLFAAEFKQDLSIIITSSNCSESVCANTDNANYPTITRLICVRYHIHFAPLLVMANWNRKINCPIV